MGNYQPDRYWEERLSKKFNLAGTGHAEFSERYNRWLYRAKERALAKCLRDHGITVRGKAVCDVGCGTGYFIDFYRRREAVHLTGIDIAGVSVGTLKRRYPEYCFMEGDISSPSIPATVSRRFDVVNVLDVLYHVTSEDGFDRAIANVSSLCAPGGYIIISDLYGADRDEAPHVRFRSASRYENALAVYGIEVLGIHPLYFMLNRPIFGGRFDNFAAPLYYALDGILMSRRRSNLKLLIARKRPQ